MRVPRVHAPDLPLDPGSFTLEGDEATHLSRVLRIRPGAEIELFDGRGQARMARVASVTRGAVELELTGPGRDDPRLAFALDVAVSPPKGKREHRLVEGLTELGVNGFAPLLLKRTEERPAKPDEVTRWSLEAAKQCGRNRALEPLPPVDLAGVLAMARARGLGLLCDPRAARPLAEVLRGPRPESVLLVVGPEGGFEDDELVALREAGLVPVRLGPTVLRIETAALAVAAACVAAWGDP